MRGACKGCNESFLEKSMRRFCCRLSPPRVCRRFFHTCFNIGAGAIFLACLFLYGLFTTITSAGYSILAPLFFLFVLAIFGALCILLPMGLFGLISDYISNYICKKTNNRFIHYGLRVFFTIIPLAYIAFWVIAMYVLSALRMID